MRSASQASPHVFPPNRLSVHGAVCLLLGIAVWIASAGRSEASIIITAQETGGNVVFSYTGSVDTTGFPNPGSVVTSNAFINPSVPAFEFSPGTGSNFQRYGLGAVTPAWPAFGTGGPNTTAAHSGSLLYLSYGGSTRKLGLPVSYSSGTTLNGSMTFNSATFSSLGITPGTYVYDISVAGNASQTITLNAVPEPSIASMLAVVAMGGCGWIGRRACRRVNAAAAR